MPLSCTRIMTAPFRWWSPFSPPNLTSTNSADPLSGLFPPSTASYLSQGRCLIYYCMQQVRTVEYMCLLWKNYTLLPGKSVQCSRHQGTSIRLDQTYPHQATPPPRFPMEKRSPASLQIVPASTASSTSVDHLLFLSLRELYLCSASPLLLTGSPGLLGASPTARGKELPPLPCELSLALCYPFLYKSTL